MKVKNINGTSQNRCKCGSWLQHWKKFSGQTATRCRAKGCSRTDLSGAHVQKAASYDNNWYIVPFCTAHNHTIGQVELVDGTVLVSANKSKICG